MCYYAFSLLAGIIKCRFVPEVVAYTTLILGFVTQDKPLEAEDLFKKLIIFEHYY